MGREGGGNIARKLVAMVVLLVIAYAAAVTIPVVLATFRFAQAMDDEVLHGPANEPASTVQRRLEARAEILGLEIPRGHIVVQKTGTRYEIDADYIVPIELVGGIAFDWPFHPHKAGVRRSDAYLRD